MNTKRSITPPDDLIDFWGDLQIPWTQKAKLISNWGYSQAIDAIQIPNPGPDPLFTAGLQEAKNRLMTLFTTSSADNYDHV